MIKTHKIHHCTKCRSENIRKNGLTGAGKQKYHCKDCGSYGSVEPKKGYSEEERELVISASLERTSVRGLERIFGVSRQTISEWIKKKVDALPCLSETLVPATPNDILELDELWSYIGKKSNKSWTWVALCRRTRQIVGFAVGDRSTEVCYKLKASISEDYARLRTYSDFWEPYQNVFIERHESVGKETGETAHIERWNNTLRQRVGRFVRKTMSFSKIKKNHIDALNLFIYDYNMRIKNRFYIN